MNSPKDAAPGRSQEDRDRLSEAKLRIEGANRLRDSGAAGVVPALAEYDAAAAILEPLSSKGWPEADDELASAWTNKGIALMEGDAAMRAESLPAFRRAIDLRTPLVDLPGPWYRYNLAGVWMNYGSVLWRSGDKADIAMSIDADKQAVEILDGVSANDAPQILSRTVQARLCYGSALLFRGNGEGDIGVAVAALRSARAVPGVGQDTASVHDRLMLACAWANEAEGLYRIGQNVECRACAIQALKLAASHEAQVYYAANLGIRARVTLCNESRNQLGSGIATATARKNADEAAELAEEALTHLAKWAEGDLGPLLRELYRFCTEFYAKCQPHFLAEFLSDHTSWVDKQGGSLASTETRAVRSAINSIIQKGFAPAEMERSIEALRDLQAAARAYD
ncbi:MAG TPA: hypothetical protein VGG34_11790 [Opitutaceae bacterium]